jgi:penicillin-insensitive murein endopeptidase
MLLANSRRIDPGVFGRAQMELLRTAARQPDVARIFVHPGIKQALCTGTVGDRSWLRKIRPWWGHDTHFHVRLTCPPGEPLCREQEPPPPGDGCGAELDWWLSDEPWIPKKPPQPPPAPLRLGDLPEQCRTVLRQP